MDNITFRTFEDADYDAVIGFFVELCKDARDHINWNWARFEWMYEHPEFNKDLISSRGLWLEGERVVGASIYDMYYGEAFIGVLPSYEKLYPAVIEYAYGHLRDDNGLGIAVLDTDDKLIYMLRQKGFLATGQDETVLSADLSGHKSPVLPEGIRIEEMDSGDDLYKFGWML